MRPVRSSAGSYRPLVAAIGISLLLVTLSACDGSSTGPGNPAAPIELDAYVTVQELGGLPSGLHTDYCECVPGPVTLVTSSRPPEIVECQGSYGLASSGGERREVTLIGRGWRVTEEYTLPVDPHLSIRVDATCREL